MKKALMLSLLLAVVSTSYAKYYDWQSEYDGTGTNTVVLWNFDEFESSERAYNVVNNHRPYVIKQGAASFAPDGKFGGCFRNEGGASSADYGQVWGDVSAPIPFPEGTDPSLSVEMWVNMNDYTYSGGYLADKGASTKSGYILYLYRTNPAIEDVYRLYFKIGDGTTDITIYADLQWNAGEYYHIAGTWDAATDTAKIYRNGVQYAAQTFAGVEITDSVSALKLANRVQSTYAAFNGAIDGVRVSNVAYEYAVPVSPYAWMNEYDGSESDTVALWNFDEFDANGQALNVVTNYRPYVIKRGASSFANDGKFGGCFRNVGGTSSADYGQIWGGDMPFPAGVDPSLSVEMWVSMDEYSSGVAYLIDKYATTKKGYQIYMNQIYADRETVYRVYFNTGDGVNVNSVWADMVWRPGKYYHLACTWNAETDTAKIYRNGREYVAKTFPGIAIEDSAYGPRLGNRLNASYGAFKGAFDGLRISSVAHNYAAPAPADPFYDWTTEYDGSNADTVALWNFNENETYVVGADTCALNSFSNITVNGWATDYRMIPRGVATFEATGGAFDPNLPGGSDGCFKNLGGEYSADFAFAWGGAEIFPTGSDPSLTIESWVKFDDVTDNVKHYIFDKCWTLASGYQLYFYKESWMGEGQYYSWFETGDGTTSARVTELCTFEAGRYYHIAGVWDADADVLSLYIDGELIGASYWPGLEITNNTQVLRIGNRLGSSYGCLEGTMDGARISDVAYNFALFEEEVLEQPGDITGDGYVGQEDLSLLAEQWLTDTIEGTDFAGFFTPAEDTKSALDEDLFYPDGQNMLFSYYGITQYDLDKVKDTGVTAIGPYYGVDDATNLRGDAVLSYVDDFDLGVKYIYRLGMNLDWDAAEFVMPTDNEIITAITALVDEVKDDENIAVWYLAPEELRSWMPNELHYLDVATAAIRAADADGRPIWMYEPNARQSSELEDTLIYQDYFGKGSYTNIGGYEKERVWIGWSMEQITDAVTASGATGTAINVLEMAQDPALSTDYDLVSDYVHHDAYLSLISGAKGFVVWSGARRTGFDTFTYYQEAYNQVAEELNGDDALADAFLYGEPKSDITAAITAGPTTASASNGYSAPSISCVSYNGIDGARYLFIVNSANAQVDIQVSGLPSSDAYIKDVFAQSDYSETTGTMTLSLSPWQVYAYRIVSETAACELENGIDLDSDISGADGSPDCIVNMYDFAEMAANWLDCTGDACI